MGVEGGDAELGEFENFGGVTNAVGVAVVPEADAAEFVAGEEAVGVVVEGTESVVAVFPKHPEGDVAEHLESGSNAAALREVNDPGGVGGDPLPTKVWVCGAVEVEGDGRVRVDQCRKWEVGFERNNERSNVAWHLGGIGGER